MIVDSQTVGWQRFQELRQDGQLASAFGEVQRLIKSFDREHLIRAGHALAQLDPVEVAAANPKAQLVSIAIGSSFVHAPLAEMLTAELARHGLLPVVQAGAFNQYLFDFGDASGGLYAANPDLCLCLIDADIVFSELAGPWHLDDVEKKIAEKLKMLQHIVKQHDSSQSRILVLNTLPLPRYRLNQLRDYRSRMKLSVAWRQFNAALLDLGLESDKVIVLDLDVMLTETARLDEPRTRIYASAKLDEAILGQYARDVGHITRALLGLGKKCLVLDLDETLWGGVLGDDGPDRIELGYRGRGAAFTQFQVAIRQLASQGILLTIASKNDEAAVRSVLSKHADMVLKEDQFVEIRANWEPKDQSIASIAETLNLGSDSFVFIDDSSFECGLVSTSLPEVAVIELGREPALHLDALLKDDWFAALNLTAEDSSRSEKYRAESQRRALQTQLASLSDYLHALEIKVELFSPSEMHFERLSQITQRTNQFNLTGKRMDVQQVRNKVAAGDSIVLGVSASDKYGSYGLVGAVFGTVHAQSLDIENFLLSCRVFSRGIEDACLSAVLRYARENCLLSVSGAFRESEKNKRFAGFFSDSGFVLSGDHGGIRHFTHDLSNDGRTVTHVNLTFSPKIGAK